MSYDLMVFDALAAPRDRKVLIWFDEQTQWTESHGYNNPEVPTEALRAWFREMIKSFPPMNGPLARDDFDDSKVTDYSVGRSVIYAAFVWSEAEPAFQRMIELAAKHRVGFFDVSSNDGEILLPTPNGKLAKLEA